MFASFPATLFLSSDRLFRAIHGGTKAIFEGVWMGLLPESAWDTITERSYGAGREYTNSSYIDGGFHFWEEIAIRRFFRPGSRVLVAAAGGGRELVALARAGFHADGFECCRPMVAAGQQALAARKIDGRLEWAPPCMAPRIAETYDALIVGWNGYSYMAPRERRLAFLRNLRPCLSPGSPVLVSGFFRPYASRSEIWTPRIANAVRRGTLRSPVFETGDSFSGRPQHHFTRAQIDRELTEAGFTPIAFYIWGLFGAVVCIA